MADVRHLGFVKFEFFNSRAVKGPILHQLSKFRKDRSNHCGDIAILVIFQDSDHRHLGFSKIQNFNGTSAVRVTLPDLIKIGQTVADIWRFNGFFKWWSSAILDLLGDYWDHPQRPLDGLHRCAKFGRNRCRSFDNMKLSIFLQFGLKTPIHAPKIGVFGAFYPQNEEQCQRNPQKAHLQVVTVLAVY